MNAYTILVRKLEGKILLGRRRNSGDNIKVDLKETGREGVDWIKLLRKGQVAGCCEHGNGFKEG
jgi:hypothetical protein